MIQAFNPFLPSYEYIPDPEPYVFGDRVYIFGSHDRFGGKLFCLNDYVCYSAPTSDLADWRYEGVIYKKSQDPKNKFGIRLLFAPDVTQGPDGRFYFYYGIDFMGIMGVAVSDVPQGPYEFHGHVKYADGTLWGRKKGDQFPFDPGVLLDDDGTVYLYSGFAIDIPAVATGFRKLKSDGGVVMVLAEDMLTIKNGPTLVFNKQGQPGYENHEFFEASSIRKINGKYYFVYSSRHNHELCYAVSDSPMGGFEFGGTLISIGDLFLDGSDDEQAAKNYLGNTHGGLVQIEGQWYIFYHRQTNRHSYSRQACAEKLALTEDGRFLQAEVTSCGLNKGALQGEGTYEARIACHLWSGEGVGRYDGKRLKKVFNKHPYFTQKGKDGEREAVQYIANMHHMSVAGFKYFDFVDLKQISICIGGNGQGVMKIFDDVDLENEIGQCIISESKDSQFFSEHIDMENGAKALYFRFEGIGSIDFYSFGLIC